jgi:branched-subunit amino acid ABC-type transport system permease component
VTLSNDVVTLLAAMTEASSLFIAAAGLTLVFGAMRIINIAHGSFFMYGALIVTSVVGGAASGRFWLGLLAAPLALAMIGAGVEIGVLRRIYKRDHLVQLVATYALFLIFADIALHVWGSQPRSVTPPSPLGGSVVIGSGKFPSYDLFAIGAAVVVGVALWALLQRTALGWRIRAAAEDPEILAVSGTNVPLLSTAVLMIGAALAGFAGALAAPLESVAPGLDATIVVSAFIVAVIGGLGSVGGAALAAMIISLFDTVGVIWVPQWSSAFIYIAMIAVLALRPWGLLGASER